MKLDFRINLLYAVCYFIIVYSNDGEQKGLMFCD